MTDTLIVGQGLAGTTLAWTLLRRGATVRILDGRTAPAASSVAAGALAPVGGKRLGVAWRAEQAWPVAIGFYRQVEADLRRPLLEVDAIVRLFHDEQQRGEFQRRAGGSLKPWIVSREAGINPRDFRVEFGGFQATGARLNVAAYLDASREAFVRMGLMVERDIDNDRDLAPTSEGVTVDRLGLIARRVVLCRGAREPQESGLPFELAKGEVLTVRVPGLSEQRVVQRGVWLAPVGDALFRVGATFDRGQPDALPTPAGRERLEAGLRGLLRASYEVVDHQAGVRPIVATRRPIAGGLPGRARFFVFNGLGASGTLWAPWAAEQLAAHLLEGTPLDPEIDAKNRL